MFCAVCNMEVKNIHSLSCHIIKSKNHPTIQEYYNLYLGEPAKCSFCGKPTKFENMVKGYKKYCSIVCVNKSLEHVEKVRKSNLEKYGVVNVFQLNETKQKSKNTCLEKYGTEYSHQNKEVIEKTKQTNLDRHGHTCALHGKEVEKKTKQTNLERYGVEYALQSEEIKQKGIETCLEKYGVKHPSQVKEIRENQIKSYKRAFYNKLMDNRLENKCIPNFEFSEYIDIHKKHEWICNGCGNIFLDHLDNGHIPRCQICFPKKCGIYSISNGEKELSKFIQEYYPSVVNNDRVTIVEREIDVYIPELKLGIEYNGNYWHSELNGKDKNYHLKKTELAEEKGIQLIHIFEDEWFNKQDIVKSILLNKLGKTENRIYARKCTIDIVPKKEAKQFLNDNHLQGEINGKHFGLYHNNELVSILTIGKPRYNKQYDWEILRYCCKNYTTVVGGLSKLISHIQTNCPGTIITYVDRRYGTGSGYASSGFTKIGATKPTYYYMNNYSSRENRLKYQKHRLETQLPNFDQNLTEWQNMQLNDFDRIWDCGNFVYILNNKK